MKVFLFIFVIIFLFALLRIKVSLEYSEQGFSAIVRFLFLRFNFPKKKTKKNDLGKSREKEKKKPGNMDVLKTVITPVLKTMGKLVRMLCVRKLQAEITIASDDAFMTAMMFGGAAAGIETFFPFIDKNIKIKKKYITVNADFESNESKVYLLADISVCLWQIAALAIFFVYHYLKKSRMMRKKGIETNG